MTRPAAKLLREALALPDQERAALVGELLDSLEPQIVSDGRSDEAWIAEVERRARAALQGHRGVSWNEARARIKGRLKSK